MRHGGKKVHQAERAEDVLAAPFPGTALAARKEARAAKDFAKSDIIRDDLIAKGVEVMDGDPLGWDWRLDI
jgi:cysteinyl-tRNA synthetase